jgi:hypothetical protein
MINGVTSPESFFGFRLGSDRKIARWDRIVEYYKKLQGESNKVKVIEMGPSTEGNPFLLVVISSPQNLEELERIRGDNLRLSDPRGLSEEEVEALIGRGRVIICQSMSLHATEIGGTQMAPELAYELATREDEETRRILDNVVFLMVPCFNPDGEIMVADWYTRWLGTEYEGENLPWLYHKYTGHDNNRDAFQTNMVESRYMAKIMFREWVPQAYLDHHHTGSYSARIFVPPYCEPIHPHGDPLIWREHSWFGAHIGYRLEQAGKSGAITGANYLGWGHLGFHWITIYHNIAGMLTESASAKLATPLYIHPSQLKGDRRGTLPTHDPQTNYPNPWPGGWWRLRDIVERQKIAAWALLDMAARHRETLLRNAYLKARRQTERGVRGSPAAYVIPAAQHDPLTAAKLVEKLLIQGLEVQVSREGFTGDGIRYPAGSYIVPLAQPKLGLARTLLGRTHYPDNPWTHDMDGKPLRPQDAATDTMAEFMGVRVDPVDHCTGGSTERVTEPIWPVGDLPGESEHGYALDCSLNDSFTAVNRLLATGAKVSRTTGPLMLEGGTLPPGSFVIEGAEYKLRRRLAEELHIVFHPLHEGVEGLSAVKRPRIGIYQRYWGGNMDEGWTRFVLEQFDFPYVTLTDDEIGNGNLRQRFDTIILPSDPEPYITGEGLEEYMRKHSPDRPVPNFPPEYRSGIGSEGVESLREFVEEGGALIALNEACQLVIDRFDLKLRNVLQGVPSAEFFCPGSTLRAQADPCHPAAYGMPGDPFVFFWGGPAFEIIPSAGNDQYDVVVSYPERDVLRSGWLIGEDRLRGRAGMVVARRGGGRIVLVGFRPQHRGQTHGTYKLLFNSLLG